MIDKTQRRLAAILAADVAGYTRLVELDTDGTVAAWTSARDNMIKPLIDKNSGHIIKFTGDGFLVEFPSVQNAVVCAITLQEELRSSSLNFRIGINVGDITDDGSDVHGEGVNIAARLEALAEPGGICISGDVYNQVRNRIDAVFTDMGEQEVKHVSQPVSVFAINPTERKTSDHLTPPAPALPDKPSIAVLPFDNLSGDPEQEYFVDGVTEDILTALSRFSQEITVIDRHSSFTYKGQSVTAKQVGQDLGAAYMLEGSVRRSGGRVRITAQLIDCATGGHLWAEKYDRSLEDIFEVQDEITRHITTALSIELVYGTYSGNWVRGTESFEAWDALSKGAFEFMKFTRSGFQACLVEVDRALVADPACGTAFAFKGWGLAMMARYFSSDPGPLWEQAREWCEKALAVEASRPLGLGLLAFCQMNEARLEQAVESFKEAISLAPSAENHFLLGQTYLYLGRAKDSIAQTRQAMRLSPLCPGYFLFNMIESYRILGQFEEALLWADKCIDKMPDSPLPVVRKACLLSLTGRREAAEDLAKQLLALEPNFSVDAWAKGQPFRNPEHIEPFAEALRQIGLPD